VNFLDILSGEFQVSVKTNVAPEIKIWDGKGQGGGIGKALGIQGAVIVRDMKGNPIFVHGAIPKTNLLLTGIYLAGASYLAYLLWRGFTRKRR
jgi:hypothetical protein